MTRAIPKTYETWTGTSSPTMTSQGSRGRSEESLRKRSHVSTNAKGPETAGTILNSAVARFFSALERSRSQLCRYFCLNKTAPKVGKSQSWPRGVHRLRWNFRMPGSEMIFEISWTRSLFCASYFDVSQCSSSRAGQGRALRVPFAILNK